MDGAHHGRTCYALTGGHIDGGVVGGCCAQGGNGVGGILFTRDGSPTGSRCVPAVFSGGGARHRNRHGPGSAGTAIDRRGRWSRNGVHRQGGYVGEDVGGEVAGDFAPVISGAEVASGVHRKRGTGCTGEASAVRNVRVNRSVKFLPLIDEVGSAGCSNCKGSYCSIADSS